MPELRDTVSRRLHCKQDEVNDGLTGAGRGSGQRRNRRTMPILIAQRDADLNGYGSINLKLKNGSLGKMRDGVKGRALFNGL